MAFGFYDHGLVALCERLTDHLPLPQRSGPRQRLWKVRCRRAILATGAFERPIAFRSEEHTSELQSLMRISYAVFCLKKKKQKKTHRNIKDGNKQSKTTLHNT